MARCGAGSDFDADSGAATPPVTMAFNELSASTNAEFWLELVNYGTNSLSLDGYVPLRATARPTANTSSRRDLALGAGRLPGFHQHHARVPSRRPATSSSLRPVRADQVLDGVVVKKRRRGRSPDGTGPWLCQPCPPRRRQQLRLPRPKS